MFLQTLIFDHAIFRADELAPDSQDILGFIKWICGSGLEELRRSLAVFGKAFVIHW